MFSSLALAASESPVMSVYFVSHLFRWTEELTHGKRWRQSDTKERSNAREWRRKEWRVRLGMHRATGAGRGGEMGRENERGTQRNERKKNAGKINDLVHLSFCRCRTTLVMNKSKETEVGIIIAGAHCAMRATLQRTLKLIVYAQSAQRPPNRSQRAEPEEYKNGPAIFF